MEPEPENPKAPLKLEAGASSEILEFEKHSPRVLNTENDEVYRSRENSPRKNELK